MKFFVDENLVSHGIEKVVIAKAGNVQVKAPLDPEVEAKIKNVEQEVLDGKKDWILNDPITQGYENLVTSCNRSIKKNPPTVPDFIASIKRRGSLPHINTVVDIYNLETLISGVAIGGHDVDKITGTLRFMICGQEDSFTSIGGNTKHVAGTDYVYRDDQGIITWLGTRDSTFYKIDDDTQNVLFVIAGNANTSVDLRLAALERIHQDLLKCMPQLTFATVIAEAGRETEIE